MNNYIKRIAEIDKKLEKKSLFLFGPRQTGKSQRESTMVLSFSMRSRGFQIFSMKSICS